MTRSDSVRTALAVKLSLQLLMTCSEGGTEGQTTQREIHVHSNYRKQTPTLNPRGKHYNFGSILFISSQKGMNGPMSRWTIVNHPSPISTCPSSGKRVPKVSPSALSQSRPSVGLVNPGTVNLNDYLPLSSKTFPSTQLESSDSLLLLCQPFKPKTPGRPSGAHRL